MSDEKAGRTVVLKNGKVVRRGISAEERKSIRQETARKARAAMKEKRALEAAMRAQEEAEVAEVLKKDSGILGEEPLTDAREERYCQLVCSGVKEVEAWQRAYKTELGEPRAKGMTAIKSNSRTKSRPSVVARLHFLRKENSEVAKIGREEKLAMVEAVMRGLMNDFSNGERGKTVSDLQGMLSMHNQMTGESEKPTLEIKLDLSGLVARSDADVEKRLGLTGE